MNSEIENDRIPEDLLRSDNPSNSVNPLQIQTLPKKLTHPILMSSSDQPQTPSNRTPSTSAAASNCTPEVIDAEAPEEGDSEKDKVSSLIKGYASDEIEFRTPTSRDHKIPRSRSCPPAPRKPKPMKSMAHKRKLMFEDSARVEVDAFFERSDVKRRSFGSGSGRTASYSTANGNNDASGGS